MVAAAAVPHKSGGIHGEVGVFEVAPAAVINKDGLVCLDWATRRIAPAPAGSFSPRRG